MPRYDLVPHPETLPTDVRSVSVQMETVEGQAGARWLEFHVAFDGALSLPEMRDPGRANELWKTTCFELFLKPLESEVYFEFNFSPSFQWAAYRFDRYRAGMHNFEPRFEPRIEITPNTGGHFGLATDLDVSFVGAEDAMMSLSAVIEEADGTKSYWALAHAPGKPDFHNADCFTARLAAPDRA